MTIDRKQLIAEEFIREHIRKRISLKLDKQFLAETKIRSVIKKLIEAETGTEEPSAYTGINVLADLLEKIIPVIEDDFKMLTTSSEQRESFRNHIIHAIKNSLTPIEAAEAVKKIPEDFLFDVDKDLLYEKIKIDLDPEDDGTESVEGEFIDIDSDSQEDDGFVQIDDQNETGRNFAATTFNKVEKQIVDAYDMLADEKDQKMFYDYLVTNMLLYFDKFEDELQPTLPDATTPEYEEEKSSSSEEAVDSVDLDEPVDSEPTEL